MINVEAVSTFFLLLVTRWEWIRVMKVMMKQTQIDSCDEANNRCNVLVMEQQALYGQYLIRSVGTQKLWYIG